MIARFAFSPSVIEEYQTEGSEENGESASVPTVSVPLTINLGAAEKTACPAVAMSNVAFGATNTCGTAENEVVDPVILRVPLLIEIAPVVV